MKLIAILTAILTTLFASVALADAYATWTIKPHQLIVQTIELPEGQVIMDIKGSNNERITCVVVDRASGKIVFDGLRTQRCIGTSNLALPANVDVGITNEGETTMEATISIRKRYKD
jgi:hypothetical protein